MADGLVFIPGIDGYVNCLDGNSGNIIWRFRTDKSVCSEPMVMGDYVYFGSWDAFLYKFEKRTGKLVWKYAGGGSDSGVAIGFDGKLILPGAGMTCIDDETTELIWRPNWKVAAMVPLHTTMGRYLFRCGQAKWSHWMPKPEK